MSQVLGGEVIAAMLVAEGVDTIFGIVDGTYLGLYASFDKYGIRLISPRHETTAAHMAGAYARLTGKLGVCMASNGPGVANILPGVAVENGEGHRVLLLTSSRRRGITYPDRGGTYQYFDQIGVTRAMTKWSGTAADFARIPEMMHRAFRISQRGRPGVVHVDVPENVFNGTFEVDDTTTLVPAQYRRTDPLAPTAAQVERAAILLRNAERPVLHAGSGVIHAGAYSELAEVAALLEAPVTTSWAARAAVDESSQNVLPLWAMAAINDARSTADTVLVIGSRLGETDWWGKPPYWGKPDEQKLIQVDIDEEILGLNKPVELAIVADARVFLAALASALCDAPPTGVILEKRRRRLSVLAGKRDATRAELDQALTNDASPLHSARVPVACDEVFGPDAVTVVDGGNTAVWASFYHRVLRPNTVLSTFKFGMLGAGVGQALAAKVARPEHPVVCILGDGAMGFHVQEIETAVRNELPVTYVVLCDRQWGMVKLTQAFGLPAMRKVLGDENEGTVNADFHEIRFDDVARAMGAHGERVAAPGDLVPALQRCLDSGKPAVVHVDVDPQLHLGAPGLMEFKAMHQEPEG